MLKIFQFSLILILFPLCLSSQETASAENISPDKKAEEKTVEKSVKELREEKLLYGINTEILELLKSLKEEKNPDFNKKLSDILSETKNIKVSENIIDLFMETEYYDADDTVFNFIEDKEYSGKRVVRKSIIYLSETGKEKYHSVFLDLLESGDDSYRIEAVKAISKTGKKEFTSKLIDQYENDESDSVRIEILLNIGELKDSSATDFLIDILNDDFIDKTSKQYACYSLGLINDKKAYPYLLKTYEDTDPYIRSYALDAISKFSSEDTESILLQALKDDSWQIRKQAAVSASELKNSNFVPFLKYKALHDPAKPVRTESVKALSAIASSDSVSFLMEKAADKKTSIDLRKLILVELINNNLQQSLSVIDSILEDEWESKTPMTLDTICSTLASKKSDKLEKYYSRMLDHPSLTIKLAGMKGIKLNKCSSLKDKIEIFTKDGVSSSIKNYARGVLEEL